MSALDDIEAQIVNLFKTTSANPDAQRDATQKIYSTLSGITEDSS
jgi:hypothetical protein